MQYTGRIALMAAALMFLISCYTPMVANPTPISRTQAPYTPEEYRVQVGDVLDVKFYYNPELNDQVTVRPDGKISLQLAPEVMAAGLTPRELSNRLREMYRTELKNPQVTVMIRGFGAQRVYIDGEVGSPGMVNLTGPLTVLQAIAESGGIRETARTNEVIIIRRTSERKPFVMTVDIESAITGRDLSQDIYMMPFDIVFVPRSPVANVNV